LGKGSSDGDWTQGLAHSIQAHYHWALFSGQFVGFKLFLEHRQISSRVICSSGEVRARNLVVRKEVVDGSHHQEVGLNTTRFNRTLIECLTNRSHP
jgi:hypothetical protein